MEPNPYESPTVATPEVSRESQNTATDIAALAVTSLAFTLALAQALGQYPWDLSVPNFNFTYWFGAGCGVPGAAATAALTHQYPRRWLAAAAIGILWPFVCGICFYLYVSIFTLG